MMASVRMAHIFLSLHSATSPFSSVSTCCLSSKFQDYHGPIFWNYGCLPQTWENPNEEHPVNTYSSKRHLKTYREMHMCILLLGEDVAALIPCLVE